MCLVVFALSSHRRYRLVLAANRDEYYDRPAQPAGFWPEKSDILAGRDLLRGGTWLGLSGTGHFAALTNYRDPSRHLPGARSRGELVSGFLTGSLSPEAYLKEIKKKGRLYNGFSLLAGDTESLWYYSNTENIPRKVGPGIHGLSNHLLDTPWPKVRRAKEGLAPLLEHDQIEPTRLFGLLADATPAPDDQLPRTGVGLTWERILSPVFIKSPTYGTRCSSVLLIDHDNRAFFSERIYTPGRKDWQEAVFNVIFKTTV